MARRSFLCWVLFAGISHIVAAAEHPITVDDVINGPIIGSLGKPLGTMAVITAEGGKPSKGAGTKIISAEGRVLENPLRIPLVQKLSSDVAFKPDEAYELVGFESGEFGGSPPATHGLQPQQPFQFHHFFVVVKIIKPDSDDASTIEAICQIARDGGGDGKLAKLKELLEERPEFVNAHRVFRQPRKPVSEDGYTPLQIAARWGHADVAAVLLEEGATVDPNIGGGWTPLQLAARDGYLPVVKLLVEHGADVRAKTPPIPESSSADAPGQPPPIPGEKPTPPIIFPAVPAHGTRVGTN